jgi:hypothetical protein
VAKTGKETEMSKPLDLDDTYTSEDLFMCEECETFAVTFTPDTVEFSDDGDILCPHCHQGMEEDYLSGDYVDEEKAERQQMGLCDF